MFLIFSRLKSKGLLFILLIFLVFIVASCSLFKKKPEHTQLELQEDIQRFYSRFTQRVLESFQGHESFVLQHRSDLVRRYLLYDSEALKITTAPFPVVNLFDMLVFIKLNRMVVEEHYVKNVYGKDMEGLANAFAISENDLNKMAYKYIKEEGVAEIDKTVRKWRTANPTQVNVEKFRLADFSKFVNVKGEKGSGFSISLSNLIVDTKSATEAVDDVVLLSNRAIFLAQHLPLILRLQARVGYNEMLSDTFESLASAPQMMEEVNSMQPLVGDLTTMIREADQLSRNLKVLLGMFPKKNKEETTKDVLGQIQGIADSANEILSQLNGKNINPEKVSTFKKELYSFLWSLLFMMIAAVVLVSIIWWGSYYIVKRLLMKKEKQQTI